MGQVCRLKSLSRQFVRVGLRPVRTPVRHHSGRSAAWRSLVSVTDATSDEVRDARRPYQRIPAFGEWAKEIRPSRQYHDFKALWIARRQQATDTELDEVLDYVLRSAALETGAIEGLYSSNRGVTITVAAQSAAWQLRLDELGANVRSHFEAQLAAFQMILDAATNAQPITEKWLREVHAVTCAEQKTHRVLTPLGGDDRPLSHGSFKSEPNHVTLADGTLHEYCPVSDVPSEMGRLIEQTRTAEFLSAPPVVQVAYFHHGFATIHPFADGNGRVARAASSVFVYRDAGVPLVVFADQKAVYFDALASADDGQPQALVDFLEDRIIDAMNMAGQRFESARAGTAARRLGMLVQAQGGLAHAELEAVAGRLLEHVHAEVRARLSTDLPAGFGTSETDSTSKCNFDGPYHSPPGRTGVFFRTSTSSPVDASTDLTIMVGVANTADERFAFTLMDANRPEEGRLFLRLDDAYPQLTEACNLQLRMWAEARVGRLLEDLANGVEAGLRHIGYTPN
jgi:Fic/DOC family